MPACACLPVRACLCVPACACTHADRYARRQVRTQTGIVPSPYYYLISPVGTMHRAPTLPFPDQVEDRFVYFLGYNHNIEFKTSWIFCGEANIWAFLSLDSKVLSKKKARKQITKWPFILGSVHLNPAPT